MANNSIRGPQSALTDYLASQNISAYGIRQSVDARRRAAATNTSNQAANDEEDDDDDEPSATTARQARAQKRKKQADAIAKIKDSKAFKRQKMHSARDEDDLALDMYQEKFVPVPGQIDNCEECKKRFTVTAYTRQGPEGGLLCPKCSSKLADAEKAAKKTAKKKATGGPAGGRSRRKIASQLLDGQVGVKSLLTLCVETLANNIDLADDLGHSSPQVIDRIARQLSKRRLLNPHTLNLFLQSQAEDIILYDAARLAPADYERIFQTCSKLKNLKLRNAIQFKDTTMEYLISRHIVLNSIYLHGANLISEEYWEKYLKAKGKDLKALRVYFTDKHFSDKIVQSLQKYCPSLTHLKICHNQAVTNEGIKHIARLKELEHLSLQLVNETSTEPYVHVIKNIGSQLRTFSVRVIPEVDDRLLDAIHDNCTTLAKLRITRSECMTDAGFARLFTNWKNRPLTFIDFELNRYVDAQTPRENRHMVGLCSDGFRAMMNHSGKRLKRLSVHGCRHITREAFEDVFSPNKTYPELLDMEISFCEEVTDFVLASIFRCCPKLKKLNVFGCMKVKEVRVPRGKILVGVPNAMGMVIEGTED